MNRTALALTAALLLGCGGCGHSTSSVRTDAGDSRDSHDDAERVSIPLPADEVRYLALGDSFTIGTGSTPDRSFPVRWASRWGAGCTPNVSNLGVNGFTTQDLIEIELPQLAGFAKPAAKTWVSLAIGANDVVAGASQDDYRAHVKTILAAVLGAGITPQHLVVVPQPDWSLTPKGALFGAKAITAARIGWFNDILAEEAKAVGARYVDLFPLMTKEVNAGMIADDGLHPSAAAYDEWGAELAKLVPTPCGK